MESLAPDVHVGFPPTKYAQTTCSQEGYNIATFLTSMPLLSHCSWTTTNSHATQVSPRFTSGSVRLSGRGQAHALDARLEVNEFLLLKDVLQHHQGTEPSLAPQS